MAASVADLLAVLPGVYKAPEPALRLVKQEEGFTDTGRRLLRLISTEERRLRLVVEEAIRSARIQAGDVKEIERLILAGRINEAAERAGRAAGVIVQTGYVQAYVNAGTATAAKINAGLGVVVDFNQVNTRAVNHMAQSRLSLIREFTEDQRLTTRISLRDSIERGLNPLEQAREFRRSVGLTARQESSVQNYRRLLENSHNVESAPLSRNLRDKRFDRTIARAKRTGKPLTTSQVDRMVHRYRERYVKYRAETIARTEALRSVHSGAEEMYRQAIDDGHINQDEMERTWVTAIDGRERESHAALNGLTRRQGETFPGKDGPLRYPGDPQAPGSETIRCRCTLTRRINAPPALPAPQ